MIVVGTAKPEPVTTSISVGTSTTEKQRIAAAAKKAGMSTSAWSRKALVAAAAAVGR
jgi:hypothetical protein